MSNFHKEDLFYLQSKCVMQKEEEDKEFDLGSEETDSSFPLTVTSREGSLSVLVLCMLGDITAVPAHRFTQWLELVRKRRYWHSKHPHRPNRVDDIPLSAEESSINLKNTPALGHTSEVSLFQRLGNAAMLDIESSSFSWNMLSSLHHTEYGNSTEQPEEEMNKALEVTVNSGGVVFFALFKQPEYDESTPKEAAAVIKFSSSRMATQSERLGCEFAKWLGVRIPQVRIIHNSSPEWQQIRQAAERAKDVTISEGDEVGEMTCSEFLEALELSRCLLLMNYVKKKERRATSVDSRLSSQGSGLLSQGSDLSDIVESPSNRSVKSQASVDTKSSDFDIVAIDSLVPRRPPAGKRVNDQENYPKLVELIINNFEYASHVLHEITGAKLGFPAEDSNISPEEQLYKMTSVVNEFRSGFRAAVQDLQGFHIFLLSLHQKLEGLLRLFDNIIHKSSGCDSDKEDLGISVSPMQSGGMSAHCSSPPSQERGGFHSHTDFNDYELQKTAPKSSSSTAKDFSDSGSPVSRDSSTGKSYKGTGEPLRSMRLTSKIRDFHKYAKTPSNLKYELKVRLEHILGRISLISDAANTEKPALVAGSLFIGGALAARSVFTLQQLGITHVLCLCSNEIGQSDSQFPELFEYKNFSISDDEDASIGGLFEEACDFINHVENLGGKILVHCFEGKSRSATVVLAYLMLRKNFTLLEAWNTLKRVHRRAQPNDGFAKILLDLDRQLHGKVSMEWQKRRPVMRVCPVCGKNAGISSSSLKLHVQKSHKKLFLGDC
ncbi:hypothetical protein Leryth_006072 [Lithospermum erythrorhizon]|nr:hypothetical protein Leryth_006072 [Lithospermum erythrorhizon]